jgi:hypothetical protein
MADRFDLEAIEADDVLLDLLAAGGDSAWAAGEHDPALKLLAELRLAVEVEDELPVEMIEDPENFLARCAALNPVTDPFARKMAARGLALGIAAVAALSVSGVAAAVTGDPLKPYEDVIKKVVDAVRPETSSPLEQLDGLPVVDKTKIVKVAKDYQKKQEEAKAAGQKAEEDRLDGPTATLPADMATVAKPPLARPPVAEQPTKVQEPLPPVTEEPQNPVDQPTSEPSSEPSGEPTTEPSNPPASEPPPSTEPTTPPTSEPPPSTEPTTPPPTDTGSTDNGSTGNPGSNPGTNPTTVPSSGGEDGSGDTGSEGTAPGNQTGDETGDQTGDQTGDSGDGTPNGTKPVEEIVVPVLPTPTGEAVEPTRLAEYLARSADSKAKHSNGKQSLGYAKAQYAKGKHASGNPAEGRHAAIARAHGSMAPMTLRQILTVLNGPMGSD